MYGVLHALIEGDARGVIEAVRQLAEQGPDWSGVLAEMLNVLHRLAIAQALPDAVDNGQGDRERVLGLAQALPAEDVQFYYQMGLIGRRDLPLAPDPRSGFEMVLLRMLAFRPAGEGDAPKVALKPLGISQAKADPQVTPVADAAPAASPAVASAAPQASAVPSTVVPSQPVPAAVEPPAEQPAPAVVAPVVTPAVAQAPTVTPPWEEMPAEIEPAAPAPAVSEAPAPSPEPAVEQPAPQQPAAEAQPEPTAELPAPELADVPVIDTSDLNPPDSDDEPPPGDYDYVSMDVDNLDYDFADALGGDQPQAEPEPEPAAMPATGLAAEWLELFPKLGLSGMTGSIAANCTLIAAEGDKWLLHLDPGHSALFNATQQRRVNDALNAYHGREIQLSIELIKPEQETPAQAAARKRANRQREAEASIQNDPLVQQMISQFAASVRAGSIEPVDNVVNP